MVSSEVIPQVVLVSCSQPQLENESDDGLLTDMALKAIDEELALRACEELHRRHARLLLGWCIKNRCDTFGDSAEDFVNATFAMAYQEADGFVSKGPKKRPTQVKAWLFQILRNLYIDSLRSEKRRPVMRNPEGEDRWLENIAGRSEVAQKHITTGRQAMVLEYLQTLSAKDRDILTVTSEFWDRDKGESAVDSDVRNGICREHGMTECSLRVRRKRLIDAGKDFIKERETKQHETSNPKQIT